MENGRLRSVAILPAALLALAVAVPATAQLAVTLNQTAFHPGEVVEVTVAVRNVGPAFSADVYVGAAEAWIESGERLTSIVLFGSVARREACPTSDLDVLIVFEGLPRSLADRRRPFLTAWERVRAARGLAHVDWNLIVKTTDEARYRSPLYLDMVEDGILILDREAFFEDVLARMRERMRELGRRRIHLPDGSWYWDLKPDFRWGDVVEI